MNKKQKINNPDKEHRDAKSAQIVNISFNPPIFKSFNLTIF